MEDNEESKKKKRRIAKTKPDVKKISSNGGTYADIINKLKANPKQKLLIEEVNNAERRHSSRAKNINSNKISLPTAAA